MSLAGKMGGLAFLSLILLTSCRSDTPANSAPTAGSFSTPTSLTTSSFTLNWTTGTDDTTATGLLRYYVRSGGSAAAIDTVAECLAATREMNWATSTVSLDLAGRFPGTTYYFNVIVQDEAGNKTIYAGTSVATVNAFVTVWTTYNGGISNSDQITLPLENTGTYNFTVSWGDSTSDTITAWNDAAVTHTYPADGTYIVTITGTLQGFAFNGAGDEDKLVEVKRWGVLSLGNSGSYFKGADNMVVTATDSLNLTGTTDLSSAFEDCFSLDSVPGMGNWDVSAVTNMNHLFDGAAQFNEDIGAWNTGNVTNMAGMFAGAAAFNRNIGTWDVDHVTNMASMFMGATAFNQDIGNWDVSQVTDMESMFSSATHFNQDLNDWDVSQVTDMHEMFANAAAFNQPIGDWDTGAVTDMNGMFAFATLFNQDIGDWDVSQVNDMSIMFSLAPAFNQDLNWDVGNVTLMTGMFSSATAFNGDVTDWDVSHVTSMAAMFSDCTHFNQNIGGWTTTSVTDTSSMFYGATIFNQNIASWDVSHVTDMTLMFYNSAFNQNVGTWDVRNVTVMTMMFYGAQLSQANYNALLIGWAALPLQNNVVFHAGGAHYSAGAATTARNTLTGTFNWTISDAGQN